MTAARTGSENREADSPHQPHAGTRAGHRKHGQHGELGRKPDGEQHGPPGPGPRWARIGPVIIGSHHVTV